MRFRLLGNKRLAARYKNIATRHFSAAKKSRIIGGVVKWEQMAPGVLVGLQSHNGVDTVYIRAKGFVCFGWMLFTAKFIRQNPLVGEGLTGNMLHFKSNGSQLYLNRGITNQVSSYNLSSPWDTRVTLFNSAFQLEDIANVLGLTGTKGGTFDTGGTQFFMIQEGRNVSDDDVVEIQTYSMSTAWEISTASFVGRYSFASTRNVTMDIKFSTDGLKMYILRKLPSEIQEYDLSGPWAVSTAVFVHSFVFAFVFSFGLAGSVFFTSSGKSMYVMGQPQSIQFSLPTPWDVSTAIVADDSTSKLLDPMFRAAWFFKPDGRRIFRSGIVISGVDPVIHEYDLCLKRNA